MDPSHVSTHSHLASFLAGPGVQPAEAQQYIESLKHAPLDGIEEILRTLMQNIDVYASQGKLIEELFQLLQSNLLRQPREEAGRLDPDLIVALYDNLQPHHAGRFILLHCLAIARTEDHLSPLCEALVLDPPATWIQCGLVLSPLFQHDDWDVDIVFPRILDALQHAAAAGVVLDLANHLVRTGKVERHPATNRFDELLTLLSGIIGRLEQAENQPDQITGSPEDIQRMVAESVSLSVSLCDTLALIGDSKAIASLTNAMQLRHRRIQTEAAGALARLGDADGIGRLTNLAAEPSARLRVLAYAEELDLSDQIDDQYKTPYSRAEAELALWLAQPSQMCVPPSHIEVVDHRRQFWPSFQDPIDCYMLRFEYTLGEQTYSNLGIVGPVVHAFEADLAQLGIDDAYAAFAGWQAEHEDIYEVDRSHWNEAQRGAVSEFSKRLESDGFENVEPSFLGFFLGEHALVSKAVQNETAGVCVTDGLETLWYPTEYHTRPLSVGDVWNIYKGRKILRTFN